MNKNLKYGMLAAAAIALPLTFHGDDAKDACSATGATCPALSAACPLTQTATSATTAAAAKDEACCAETPAATAQKVAATKSPASATKAEAGLIKVSYQVDGVVCASCETKLTKVLTSLDGVKAPEVCHVSKTAKLAYDPKKVKEARLVAAIEKAGYTVKSETIQVSVEGMSCAGCSSKVSSAVAKLKGVKEQQVCHESKTAVVTFDPKTVSRDKVVAAIDQTGFKVVR